MHVAGKGRKATLTRRINAQLREKGLPAICGLTCRVPRLSMFPTVRAALRKDILANERWNNDEKLWVLSRVKIVACKMQKHKDVWNAVRASKCVRENDFQVHSEHFDMSHCQDMRCVDKIWDIPVRPSLDEDLRLASACVSNFGVSLGLGHGACAVAVSFVKDRLPFSASFRSERGMFRRTAATHEEYTEDMCCGLRVTVVPDDKRKKFMWKVPTDVCQWLFTSLLFRLRGSTPVSLSERLTPGVASAWIQYFADPVPQKAFGLPLLCQSACCPLFLWYC